MGAPAPDLQAMIDAAPTGSILTVPAGIYDDTVLNITKRVVLKSETGQPGAAVFTGRSGIVIGADGVAILGLSFQGTECMPGRGDGLVKILADGVRSGVSISTNEFRDTCQDAIQAEGDGRLVRIVIENNVFKNTGLGRGPPGAASAINLAHSPGQDVVGGSLRNQFDGTAYIRNNHIDGTSGAGIRVFNADNLHIADNYIANTAAEAVWLAAGPSAVRVERNTIVNANNNGSGGGAERAGGDGYRPAAPGAAIGVWSDAADVTITGNTIRGSDGALFVCAGSCASGGADGGGASTAGGGGGGGQIRFNGNVVYAYDGAANGGVLIRSNATSGGMVDATGNYLVGIDRGEPGSFSAGTVSLGTTLPAVSPNASSVLPYDTYHVTDTMPVDNFGAWNMEIDAANGRLYLGTDPMEGSGHPDGSSIVYAYDLGRNGSLIGSYAVGGLGGRIADMEANPATGQLHVLHAWLDNATFTSMRLGHNQDFYRGNGGWGLNVTTLNGSDMTVDYAARMDHQRFIGGDHTTPQWVQAANYSLFPLIEAVTTELEVDAGRGLLFAATSLSSPIAVLNNSADRPSFEMAIFRGDPGTSAHQHATHVSALAVNASGPLPVAYVVDKLWGSAGVETYLSVVRFNANLGADWGGALPQNYERLGRLQVDMGIVYNTLDNRAAEIVLDDTADRLFVLWAGSRTVDMYSLDENMAGDIGIPVPMRTLERTGSTLGGYGAYDITLDEEAGILYTVVRDYTDPRVVAHNTTTGELLGESSLSNEPVSVEAGPGGRVYAAPQQWPHVYVIDPQPATDLQRMIDAVPVPGEYRVARTLPTDAQGASHVEVDAGNGRIYLGGGAGDPVVRTYDMGSGTLLGSHTVGGASARIADMEANPETGQLHVLHAWLDNATFTSLRLGHNYDFYRGNGGWGVNLTTLDGDDMSINYTTRMIHQQHAQGTGGVQAANYSLFPLIEAVTSTLEVDAARNLVFAATSMYSPAAVLNNSEQSPSFVMPREGVYPGTSGWQHAAYVSAMAVNASGAAGEPVAYMVHNLWKDNTGHATYLSVMRFGADLGAGWGGKLLQNYQRLYPDPNPRLPGPDRLETATGGSGQLPGPLPNRAAEIILDDTADRLFVLWRDNKTVSMYALDRNVVNGTGLPVHMRTLDGTLLAAASAAGRHGAVDISLDEEAGILYTVVQDPVSPRVIAHDSKTGRLNDYLTGRPLGSALLAGESVAADAAAGNGTAYAATVGLPGIHEISRASPHPGVVVVPPGTYDDTVLVIDKSLTLTSPTGTAAAPSDPAGTMPGSDAAPLFTGKSRIQVEAHNVAVRGLAFRDTSCLPGLAPPVVEIDVRSSTARNTVAVEDNLLAGTCHGGVEQEGIGSLSGVSIRGNVFENIGLADGEAAPLDTGGEDEFQLTHGAVGLAFHPGQSIVGRTTIAGNAINGTSAAGIRIFNADGVRIHDNAISNTPASAVGLSHGSFNAAVFANTITAANTEPDMDYMAGVNGSGDPSYYMRTAGVFEAADGIPVRVDWRHHAWRDSLAPHGEAPTPDAAVKVWADSFRISVYSNTIRSSGGAFVACAGTCAAESDGVIHAGGTRNVLPPADYNVTSPEKRIAFNWNVVHADNNLDGSDLIANNATGMLDATNNYYPGYEAAGGQMRDESTVNYSSPARGVANVTSVPGPGGTARAGDTIVFSVRFNMPTSVDTSAGVPALLFGADAGAAYPAAYRNGSGTATLDFAYTVPPQNAPDIPYALPRSIELNGAALEGEPNPGAALALPLSLNKTDFPAVVSPPTPPPVVVDPTDNRTVVNATVAAAFTGPNTVRIEYSVPLGAPENHTGPVYGNVTVPGGAASYASISESGLGDAVHTVRFGGAGVNASDTGTIALNTDLETAGANGTLYAFADDAIPVGAGQSAREVAVPAGATPVEIGQGAFVRTVSGNASASINATDATLPPANLTVASRDAGAAIVFAPGTNITDRGTNMSYAGVISVEAAAADRRDAAVSGLSALGVSGADGRLNGTDVVEIGSPTADIALDAQARILLEDRPAPGTVYHMDSANATTAIPICGDAMDPSGWLAANRNETAFCYTVPGGDAGMKDYTIYTYRLSAFFVVGAAEPAAPMTGSVQGMLRATIVLPDDDDDDDDDDGQRTVVTPAPVFFGGSGGGGGGSGGGGGGGTLVAGAGAGSIAIYSAAWDCNAETISVTVDAGVRPDVSIVSSSGTVAARMGDGPHPPGRIVYEAPLPDDLVVSIRAVLADGRAVASASEAVRTGGQCAGEMVFRAYDESTAAAPPAGQEPPTGMPPAGAQQDPTEAPPGTAAAAPGVEPGEQPADPQQPPIEIPEAPAEPGEAPSAPGEQPADPQQPPADPSDAAETAGAASSEPPAPAEEEEDEGRGGCLIATAAYGTEIAPQVQYLREVRDSTLLTTESGRAFMSAFGAAYYAFSPHVADLEREHPALRHAAAALVAPMLLALSAVDMAEPGSEESVLAHGALAIALVAGMYVAAPAAGAWYGARRLARLLGRGSGRAP